jgi:hypothetical protein
MEAIPKSRSLGVSAPPLADAFGVGGAEPERYSAGDGEGALNGKRAGSQCMAQVSTRNGFHGDVGRAILGLVEIYDFNHVGMAQFDGGLGLAAEAAEEGGVLGEFGGDEFEGAPPTEENVLGEVHGAHGSAAERAQDAVFAADDGARLEFVRLDEERAVSGTSGVMARVGCFAQRTCLHSARLFLYGGILGWPLWFPTLATKTKASRGWGTRLSA